MRYEIPVYWFPSALIVAKEYAILSSLECPNCRQKTLKRVRQEALPPTPQLPYPIGGDKLTCKCESCGYSLTVEFVFRPAKPDEDPFKDFELIYTFLLDNCASGSIPDYASFINDLLMIIEDIKINRPDMLERILTKFLNDLTSYSSQIETTTDIKVFNSFKLISNFISRLPEKEFEWIIEKIPKKVRNFIQALRQRA